MLVQKDKQLVMLIEKRNHRHKARQHTNEMQNHGVSEAFVDCIPDRTTKVRSGSSVSAKHYEESERKRTRLGMSILAVDLSKDH